MKTTVRGCIAIVVLLTSTVFCLSCSKTVDPVSTASGGSLIGSVSAFAVTSPTNITAAGIRVGLQATPYEATTDSLGRFRIDNIPAGVYNIVFSKPGFDSMIYPVHHLLGVGTDIVNDAFVIRQSSDSVTLTTISPVYKVSVTKTIHVIDTIIHEGQDTVIRSFDTTIVTYDTVSTPTMLIVQGALVGNAAPADLFVYGSLDSSLFPESRCPQSPLQTENDWLAAHLRDTSFRGSFASVSMNGGRFCDTLRSDVVRRTPFTFEHGQKIFIYIVGHSNTIGLPVLGGEYAHYYTVPYGPAATRYTFVIP